MKRIITSISIFLLIFIVACGSSSDPKPVDPKPDEMIFDVELHDNALVIKKDVLTALKKEDENSFMFDKATLELNKIELSEGQVLLLEDVALVKVISIEDRGSELKLSTQEAGLNELFENANIAWGQALTLSAENPPLLAFGDQEIAPQADEFGVSSINFKTKINGFEVNVNVKPDVNSIESKLTVKVTVSRKEADGLVNFKATGEGQIGMSEQATQVRIISGETTNLGFDVEDLEFDFRMLYGGSKSGTQEMFLSLPEDLRLKIPIPTGSIPLGFYLEVNLAFLIQAKLAAEVGAATTVDVNFGYSGDSGFAFNGGSLTTSGDTARASLDFGETNIFAEAGPVSVSMTWAVPQISLKTKLNETSKLSLEHRFTIVSQFRGNPLDLCIEVGASQKVLGSYQLGFFGISLASDKHEFYEDYRERINGTSERCEESLTEPLSLNTKIQRFDEALY